MPYRWPWVKLKKRFSGLALLGLLLVCGFHLPVMLGERSLAIATSVPESIISKAISQPSSQPSGVEKLSIVQPKPDLPSGGSRTTSPSAPHRQPRINIRYDFYPIQGSTTDELNRQMVLNAPFRHSPGVSDFAAITKWDVKWSFTSKMRGKQCILTNPLVNVDIRIVLPTLQTSQLQPRLQSRSRYLAVRNEWLRYIQALKVHEDGHKANGIEAAKDIQRWMELLGPARSCPLLVQNVRTVTQKMIEQYRRRDQAYDRLTDHGLTQGAILNRVNS